MREEEIERERGGKGREAEKGREGGGKREGQGREVVTTVRAEPCQSQEPSSPSGLSPGWPVLEVLESSFVYCTGTLAMSWVRTGVVTQRWLRKLSREHYEMYMFKTYFKNQGK